MIFSPLHLRLIGARLGLPLSRDSKSALIERFGSAEQKSNLELYKADRCASNPEQWCKHVSNYLETFGLSRLNLRDGEGSAFARLYSPLGAKLPMNAKLASLWPLTIPLKRLAGPCDLSSSSLGIIWKFLLSTTRARIQRGRRSMRSRSRMRGSPLSAIRSTLDPFVVANRVLSLATGDFITGHDADDWAHPQRIERQIGLIDATPGAVGTRT